MWLKQAVVDGYRKYLERPCAVPNCPCIIHRLGMPQPDVVAEVMHSRPRLPTDGGLSTHFAMETARVRTYWAAARIGTCALRKRRTRSIVRCLSSSGSFHG